MGREAVRKVVRTMMAPRFLQPRGRWMAVAEGCAPQRVDGRMTVEKTTHLSPPPNQGWRGYA